MGSTIEVIADSEHAPDGLGRPVTLCRVGFYFSIRLFILLPLGFLLYVDFLPSKYAYVFLFILVNVKGFSRTQ